MIQASYCIFRSGNIIEKYENKLISWMKTGNCEKSENFQMIKNFKHESISFIEMCSPPKFESKILIFEI